jgi:hypothetical protein
MSDDTAKAEPHIVVTPNSPTSPKDEIPIIYEEEISVLDKKRARRRTRRASKSRSGDSVSVDDTASESSATLHTSHSTDSFSDDATSGSSRGSSDRHKRHNSSDRGSGRRGNISVTGDTTASSSSKRDSSKDRSEKEKSDRLSGPETSGGRDRKSRELQKDLQLDLAGHGLDGSKDSSRGSARTTDSISSVPSDPQFLNSPGSQASTPTSGHRRKSSTDKAELPSSARSRMDCT